MRPWGVATLYLSPDTDAPTLGQRIAGTVTGESTTDIEAAFENGQEARYLDAIDTAMAHVAWDFRASPTLGDIDECLWCYAQVHGHWPQLVVVDALKDVVADVDDDGSGGSIRFGRVIEYLHQIARYTHACVVVQHHLTGPYDDGLTAPPLSALLGKIAKTPRLVLTLSSDPSSPTGLSVHVVKNTNGPADPTASGAATVDLDWDRECQIITDATTISEEERRYADEQIAVEMGY